MTAFSQHPGAEHLIVHLSDTHFLGSGRKLYDQIDSDSPLERLMERLHASEMSVDALVFTGDLADRAEVDAYQRLRDLIEPWAAKLEAELVWVMGNHDEREPFTEVLLREATLGGAEGSSCHAGGPEAYCFGLFRSRLPPR
jgi:Icc protein